MQSSLRELKTYQGLAIVLSTTVLVNLWPFWSDGCFSQVGFLKLIFLTNNFDFNYFNTFLSNNLKGSLSSISATAITCSSYINSFTNNTIKDFIVNDLHLGWDLGAPFSSYLDITAIFLTTLLFVISLFGIEIGAFVNNTLAMINILLLCVITVGGIVYGDFDNLTKGNFSGGFDGVIKGLLTKLFLVQKNSY